MIKSHESGHGLAVATADPMADFPEAPACVPSTVGSAEERVRVLVAEHFSFVWRYLRRLGVPESDADDAAQQVFIVAARRIGEIVPGSERGFLCGTALRVASVERRTRRRRREAPEELSDDQPDRAPRPDEAAAASQSRQLLEALLAAMPIELCAVFALFELEEMSTAEIGRALELPAGTVASRLRRAREHFAAEVKRLRARQAFRGGER